MRRSLLSILVAALALLLAACVTEPITGRSQFVGIVDETQANQMGVQSYQQMLGEAKLSTNAQQNALVERVGKRIAAVTDARMKAEVREAYQWEFKVIDDPQTANAWALPGGKVAVYTGILPITKDEDGLAVVMGHEVAHAYAQHGRKRVNEGIVAELGFGVVEAFLGGDKASKNSQYLMAAIGLGYQVGVQLPFSRDDESAADHIGLMLMAEAGYDPEAAVPFWERMQALGGGGQPEFLSTHPHGETRIARLRELMPEAKAAYLRAKGGARP